MKSSRVPARSGFTLPEVVVSTGVAALIGVVIFALANAVLHLYAKNFSINESHSRARKAAEKLALRIHLAVEPPTLVDKEGVAVPGNGPAAGVSCLVYISTKPYFTSNAVNLNTKTSELQSRLHLVCRLLLEKKKA